jgi:DNA-binding PadR family transcriptional regulator
METDTSTNDHEFGSLLPLTPAVFHILLALANGERHGYGILQEIAAITHAQRRIGPGTLYRSIKQMLAAGMIEEADERPDPTLDDERRRYYRLTAFGRRVALAEAQRLAQLVREAEIRRLLPGIAGTPGIEGGR